MKRGGPRRSGGGRANPWSRGAEGEAPYGGDFLETLGPPCKSAMVLARRARAARRRRHKSLPMRAPASRACFRGSKKYGTRFAEDRRVSIEAACPDARDGHERLADHHEIGRDLDSRN